MNRNHARPNAGKQENKSALKKSKRPKLPHFLKQPVDFYKNACDIIKNT
jgi:hypothetical protein